MWLAVMPPVSLLSSWLMVEDMLRADRQASSGYKLNVPRDPWSHQCRAPSDSGLPLTNGRGPEHAEMEWYRRAGQTRSRTQDAGSLTQVQCSMLQHSHGTARSSPGWGIACRQLPSPCQRRAVLSSLALAIKPSAVAAQAYTRAVWPSKTLRQVPAAFQSRRVVSWLPDTMPLPGTSASALHMHKAELALEPACGTWHPACSRCAAWSPWL